jgi:hypothetical protein
MSISYEGYRKTLTKLKENYREQYRTQGYKKAMDDRAICKAFRASYPEYSDRYTREALGYPKKEVA